MKPHQRLRSKRLKRLPLGPCAHPPGAAVCADVAVCCGRVAILVHRVCQPQQRAEVVQVVLPGAPLLLQSRLQGSSEKM